MCVGDDEIVEASAQEEQPAPADPGAASLASASAAAQAPEAMEAEDVEPATRAGPSSPFATQDDVSMEQEGPLEGPKHVAAFIQNRSKVGAKPQSSLGRKDIGRSDPEALDELPEQEAKLYQQDTGISIYVSSGRLACSSVWSHGDWPTSAWPG